MPATGEGQAAVERLDLAVVGSGPDLAAVVRTLRDTADGVRWAVAEPAGLLREPTPHLPEQVTGVLGMPDGPLLMTPTSTVSASVVVVVTSDSHHVIRGERELRGRGVSYCAACDGALFAGRPVIAALDDAGLAHEIEHLSRASSIQILAPAAVIADLSEELSAIARAATVHSVERTDGELLVGVEHGEPLSAHALFVLTAAVPAPILIPGIEVDQSDRVLVDEEGRSTVTGVFAVGSGSVSRDHSVPLSSLARVVARAVEAARLARSSEEPAQ